MRGQRTHSNAATAKRVYPKLISARLRSFFFSRQTEDKNSVTKKGSPLKKVKK